MFNKDIFKGKFKEIMGDLKARYGKLTDDDLKEVEGNAEKLVGILQKKYGYSKEQAEREAHDFMERHKKAA